MSTTLKTTLIYRVKINGAHHLPNYDGKCAVKHGHTYYIDLEIVGKVDPGTGMVMDFNDVESWADRVLPDHVNFNDYLDNPTAEVIATWLFEMYDAAFSGIRVGTYLEAITVWEDPGQGVRVCGS